MKPHRWEIVKMDFGSMGCEDMWKCADCEAEGGSAWSYYGRKKQMAPSNDHIFFYPKIGGVGIPLTTDCEESFKIIFRSKTE